LAVDGVLRAGSGWMLSAMANRMSNRAAAVGIRDG